MFRIAPVCGEYLTLLQLSSRAVKQEEREDEFDEEYKDDSDGDSRKCSDAMSR